MGKDFLKFMATKPSQPAPFMEASVKMLEDAHALTLAVTDDDDPSIQQLLKKDLSMDEFIKHLNNKDESPDFMWHQGLLYYQGNKLYIPTTLREHILSFCHDSTAGGHFRAEKTLDFIAQNYHWPDLRNSV
ncbi:hypothetical protein MMC09_001286 [Bachmanniomyces sp. S44760]|nr:hypothetical protein [Bachmanniomyces sp. S44760]